MSDKTRNFATTSSEMPQKEKSLLVATLHVLEGMGYKAIISISITERIPFHKKESITEGMIMSSNCPASQIKSTHDILCDMMEEEINESDEYKNLKKSLDKFFKMAKEN